MGTKTSPATTMDNFIIEQWISRSRKKDPAFVGQPGQDDGFLFCQRVIGG
jgi:hypothetical protein